MQVIPFQANRSDRSCVQADWDHGNRSPIKIPNVNQMPLVVNYLSNKILANLLNGSDIPAKKRENDAENVKLNLTITISGKRQ